MLTTCTWVQWCCLSGHPHLYFVVCTRALPHLHFQFCKCRDALMMYRVLGKRVCSTWPGVLMGDHPAFLSAALVTPLTTTCTSANGCFMYWDLQLIVSCSPTRLHLTHTPDPPVSFLHQSPRAQSRGGPVGQQCPRHLQAAIAALS